MLYIGKANAQKLGVRISQHQWEYRDNPNLLRIYIGRLVGQNTNISSSEWEKQIDLAEKLLIFSHKPSDNSLSVGNIPETEIMNLHIYNWNNYVKLLPEVSGGRYTTKYDYWDYDSFYNMKIVRINY